jgi:hypothetical protein
METNTQPTVASEKMAKLLNEKKSAREFQERKHADWNENYELYRNKVKTNRLTQRQAVNIPLMKETIKTLLSKVDDAPEVSWKEKSGDEMKELVYQELWNEFQKKNKFEWIDILDKKNVFLYGLSTRKLNLNGDHVSVDVLDVFDVVFDPQTNPLDVNTARFIIQQNIFKPLRVVLADERYSKEGKDALKQWLASDKGIVQSNKNKEELEKRMERIRSMGLDHEKFGLFAGGDVIVNLTEHYTEEWNTKTKAFERKVVCYADDTIELLDDSLMNLIGIDKWPFVSWMEDPETNDIYPDGVADLVRTPNKILNVWMSQLTENRSLKNFNMVWFDATVQGYQPQTYEPGPGRMLPAPGKPGDVLQAVQVDGLDDTMGAIDFLTNIIERGTGATAIEKGQGEEGSQTLGEVELLVGKAGERAKTMSKFYRGASYDLAKLWDEMMQKNSFGQIKLYKTGRGGKVYEKVVYDSDWQSEAGYEPTVTSSSEQESEDVKGIQKWSYVMQQNPNNAALRRIAQSRQLKLLDLTPGELKEIEDEEERMQQEQMMMAQAQTQQMQAQAQPEPQPGQEDQIDPALQELSNLIG